MAKDLSEKQNKVMIERAYEYNSKVVQLQKVGLAWFLELGRTLYEIREQKLYLYMGQGGYDSYEMYLANPEIWFKKSTAYAYTQIYEFYCLKMGYTADDLEKIPLNKLRRMIPLLKDKNVEEAKQIMDDSQGLSPQDVEETVRENLPEKPAVFLDPESDKWIIKFRLNTVLSIINIENGENLLESDARPTEDQRED